MDGVIIDSEPIHQALEFEMFRDLGLDISDDEHMKYVGTSSIDMWNMIKEKHDLKKTPEELLLYGRKKYWDALEQRRVPLVDGSVELMHELFHNDYLIQVASSATRPTVDKVIDFFQLEKYISHRIGGNEVVKSKPDPEIFLKAAQQSSSNPSQCLVIEDSMNGIRAAKEAGMLCIGYANPGTGSQDLSKADLVVSDIRQLTLEIIRSFK